MSRLDAWYRDLARTVPPFEFMDHPPGRRGPVASDDGWKDTQPHGSFIQEDMRRDAEKYYRGGIIEILRLREELNDIFWEYRLALFPLGVLAAWKVTELYKWIRYKQKNKG